MGLLSPVGSIGGTVALTFVAMLVLFVLSFYSAKFLSDGKIVPGVFTFVPLSLFVMFLSYFSFSYWYGVIGDGSGWVARDARVAVGEYYEFNEKIVTEAGNTYAGHQTNFRERPAISALVTDMTAAQDTISNLSQTSQEGQTLEAALNTSLEKERKRLEKLIADAPNEIATLNDQLQDAGLAVRSVERDAIKSVDDVTLLELRDDLNRSIDLEQRNGSTSVIINNRRRVAEPDFARITLHRANDLLDLDINPDACGALKTEEERAATDYSPLQRTFGKGAGGGGVCTRQLDRLLAEIEQYRTDLSDYRERKQAAISLVENLTTQIEEKQRATQGAKEDLEETKKRLANPDDIKVSLVDLVTDFRNTPTDDTLSKLRENCTFVKTTAAAGEFCRAACLRRCRCGRRLCNGPRAQ
ncbi:MAG: hypothetical protein WA790_02685 [Sulfitobacter sp.]